MVFNIFLFQNFFFFWKKGFLFQNFIFQKTKLRLSTTYKTVSIPESTMYKLYLQICLLLFDYFQIYFLNTERIQLSYKSIYEFIVYKLTIEFMFFVLSLIFYIFWTVKVEERYGEESQQVLTTKKNPNRQVTKKIPTNKFKIIFFFFYH